MATTKKVSSIKASTLVVFSKDKAGVTTQYDTADAPAITPEQANDQGRTSTMLACNVLAGKVHPEIAAACTKFTDKKKRDNSDLNALLPDVTSTSRKYLREIVEAGAEKCRMAWAAWVKNKKILRANDLGIQSLRNALAAYTGRSNSGDRASLKKDLEAWVAKNGKRIEDVLPDTLYDILVSHNIIKDESEEAKPAKQKKAA